MFETRLPQAHQQRQGSTCSMLDPILLDSRSSFSQATTRRWSELDTLPKDEEDEWCQCRDDSPPPLPQAPLSPVGFFNKAIARRRRDVIVSYLKILLILCVFAFSVLSLYWGVLARVNQNLGALKIAVVDFDGHFPPFQGTKPIVGNAVHQAVQHAMTLPNHLGYVFKSPSDFNNDPMEVRRWVSRLEGWGAIIVNNNASALLRRAVETGDPGYDPMGAAQIIYDQARDLETINQYVAPPLVALGKQIVADFGTTWAESVLTNASLSLPVYRRSPQAINPAIDFNIVNLRPFDPPAATPSVTIGLIYLIIIAFFSFGFFMPVHLKFTTPANPNQLRPTPTLKFSQFIIWRWLSTVVAYLFLSLSYSLVSLAFAVPFSNAAGSETTSSRNPNPFGPGTFPVYWAINWCGMIALGMACENVGMVIGTPWVGLWLIFWVISNVATGFYALELAPSFFRWGYIWPLHSIVEASRTLLFDTAHMFGKDFGILIGWIVVNSLLFPFACRFARRKAMRAAAASAAAAAKAARTSLPQGLPRTRPSIERAHLLNDGRTIGVAL